MKKLNTVHADTEGSIKKTEHPELSSHHIIQTGGCRNGGFLSLFRSFNMKTFKAKFPFQPETAGERSPAYMRNGTKGVCLGCTEVSLRVSLARWALTEFIGQALRPWTELLHPDVV